MANHRVVSQQEWLDARKRLLTREKEFTQQRDELTRLRSELPWTKVSKEYVFESESGAVSLSDLFGEKTQLIVYHFMFDPEWTEGCKSCSLLADHYDPAIIHLEQRDVAMVTVSRAPLEKLLSFQRRMQWSFPWVSSFGNDFNYDFQVTFTPEQIEQGTTNYNYDPSTPFPLVEAPGLSVFAKDEHGDVFHTYSTYARGLDLLLGVYNLLDLVPKGRDEADLPYTMEWIRHHDRYGDDTFVDPYVQLHVDNAQEG